MKKLVLTHLALGCMVFASIQAQSVPPTVPVKINPSFAISSITNAAQKAFGDQSFEIKEQKFDSDGKPGLEKTLFYNGKEGRIKLIASILNKKTNEYQPFKYEFSLDQIPQGSMFEVGKDAVMSWALRILAQAFYETNSSLGITVEQKKIELSKIDQSTPGGKKLAKIYAEFMADVVPVAKGDEKIVVGGGNTDFLSATVNPKGYITRFVKREDDGSTTQTTCFPAEWPPDTLLPQTMYFSGNGDVASPPKNGAFGIVIKKAGDAFVVAGIIPNSLAEKNGVDVGWRISKVGGQELATTSSTSDIASLIRKDQHAPIQFVKETGENVTIQR